MKSTSVYIPILVTFILIFGFVMQTAAAPLNPQRDLPGLSDIDISLTANGIGTAEPTSQQWHNWCNLRNGRLIFDFRIDPNLENMRVFILTLEPGELTKTSLEVIFPCDVHICIPHQFWEILEEAAACGTVDLTLSVHKGAVGIVAKQLHETIPLVHSAQPIILQIPYTPANTENVDYIVAKSILDNKVIARSWYNAESETLNVKVFTFGEYEPFYENVESFIDTENKWMDGAVKYLRARNIIYGTNHQYYTPEHYITRTEFTTLLMRTLVLKSGTTKGIIFRDASLIPAYAKDYIYTAYIHNIIYGYNGYFSPNDYIARQDMFTITYRTLLKLGILPSTLPQKQLTFPDLKAAADYAQEAVEALARLGLVSGHNTGALQPTTYTTRGECAQFIYNTLMLER